MYVVLLAVTSRLLGVPVRWSEDRAEHLLASSSATERLTEVEAGFSADGALLGLGSTWSTTSAPTCARPSRPRSTACTAA